MNVFFETEHLVVRELEPEDAMRLYENHAEEKVKKWFPNESYADINEAEDAIRFFRNCVNDNCLPFGPIFCKMTGTSVAWQTGANLKLLMRFWR